MTLDHLTPYRAGGSHRPDNLVTSCRRCNEARGAADWATREGVDPEVEARVEGLRRAPLERARGRFLAVLHRRMRATDPGRYWRLYGPSHDGPPIEPEPDWFIEGLDVPF